MLTKQKRLHDDVIEIAKYYFSVALWVRGQLMCVRHANRIHLFLHCLAALISWYEKQCVFPACCSYQEFIQTVPIAICNGFVQSSGYARFLRKSAFGKLAMPNSDHTQVPQCLMAACFTDRSHVRKPSYVMWDDCHSHITHCTLPYVKHYNSMARHSCSECEYCCRTHSTDLVDIWPKFKFRHTTVIRVLLGLHCI